MPKPKNTITEYRSYTLPLQFPVLLLSGEHWKISDAPSGRLHFHNYIELGVCHSDSGTMIFNGSPQHFQAGDVTIIPKNVPHTTYSDPGMESRWSYLYFDPQELFKNILPADWKNHELSIDFFQKFSYILSKKEHPELYPAALSVIREMENQKPNYQLIVRGMLLVLYVQIYRIQMENKEDVQEKNQTRGGTGRLENSLSIAPALEYIEQNYMQQFTIEFLADLCHWSPTHFRRVFHSIMGTSPLDYVNNTRIMKACNLLRSTEESVLNISEMVGFHSISSFNRYFTRTMKMPPRKYRSQMQQADRKGQSILEYAGWMAPE